MDLQYANHTVLEKAGRPFRCSKCKPNIARVRRCHEDRWDFEEKDGPFPIQMEKGGPTYSFCPAKVQRDDHEVVGMHQTLIAILETNTWPDPGGLNQQEHTWVDLVAEFAQYKRDLEFNNKYADVSRDVKQVAKQAMASMPIT
jgi:hypothetical protein